tara:strand:+ start:5923 stop:6387 length:465 start_codon:yes stop_codon:yes gene_type:complete
MQRDLHSNIKVAQMLANQAVTATTTSSSVDTRGFNSCEILIDIGTITNVANSPQPSWAFKLTESDDDSTFTDVTTAADVLIGSTQDPVAAVNSSTGVFLTVDAAAEDAKKYRVGYVGTKRYVKCVATAANTPGSTPLSISAILGHPNLSPADDG